jgi:hypothetical protein
MVDRFAFEDVAVANLLLRPFTINSIAEKVCHYVPSANNETTATSTVPA